MAGATDGATGKAYLESKVVISNTEGTCNANPSPASALSRDFFKLPIMVQTRSAAKRQQVAKEEVQRFAAVPKDLGRQSTVIEIMPLATGPNMVLDPRFMTPAPETPSTRTPPKLSHQRRIGNPGIFNARNIDRLNLFPHEVEHIVESARANDTDLLTEFERYSLEQGRSLDHQSDTTLRVVDTFENVFQYRTLALRSPSPGSHVNASTPLSVGPHGTHLDISGFGNACNQGDDTGYTAPELGPTALAQGPRGLGPSDTILIGPDGQAIVPGIQPGY